MTRKQFSVGAFLCALCVFANSASLLAMEGGRKRPSGDDLDTRPLKQRCIAQPVEEEACAAPVEAAAAQPLWVAQTSNLTQRLFNPNSWRDHVCCVQAPRKSCLVWLTTQARNHNPCLQIDASDAGLNAPDTPILMQRHGNEVYIVLNQFLQERQPIPTLEDPTIETLKLVINLDDYLAEEACEDDLHPINHLPIDLSPLQGLVGLHSLHVDVRIDESDVEEWINHEMALTPLAQLKNLRYLSLHGPVWNFAPLVQLQRLVYLHLNPVGGPEEPGADGAYFDWRQLAALPLETLIVERDGFDVSCLASMPTLQHFVLSVCGSQNLSSLVCAANLKYAALDIALAQALPVQISEDKRNSNCLSLPASLEVLYLESGRGACVEGFPRPFQNADFLLKTVFSLEALKDLTQLRELYLETFFKAENWGAVATLPNLEVVYKKGLCGLTAVDTVCGAQNLKALLLPSVRLDEVALHPGNIILERLLPRADNITHLMLPERRVGPFPGAPEAFSNLQRLISGNPHRGVFTEHAL